LDLTQRPPLIVILWGHLYQILRPNLLRLLIHIDWLILISGPRRVGDLACIGHEFPALLLLLVLLPLLEFYELLVGALAHVGVARGDLRILVVT
jgi:hypothetical protein